MSSYKVSRLFVNSYTDRQLGDTNTSFSIMLNKALMNCSAVRIISVVIPNYFASFSSRFSTLTMTYNGGAPVNITLDMITIFTPTTFTAYLQNLLIATFGGSWTCTVDLNNGFLTISETTPVAFTVESCSSLFKLGLVAGSSSGGSIVGTSPCVLQRTSSIKIISNLTSGQGMNTPNVDVFSIPQIYNIFYNVPVSASVLSNIELINPTTEVEYKLGGINVYDMKFNLVDDFYDALTLPDNCYVLLELEFDVA